MLLYLVWFFGIASFELVSALTILHPMAHGIALLVSTLFLAVLAYRKPSLAASLLLVEYVIGSKGALLRFGGDGIGHGGVPLRMALFAAFLVGWLAWSIQRKTYRDWLSYLRGRSVYVFLACLLVYAFLRGYFLHNAFTFDDGNAWGVWMLLLPALDLARHDRAAIHRFVPPAILTAFVWMAFKTLGLFFLFSHLTSPVWLDAIYLWVRRTGVGEITRVLEGANVWRVFFQSHIYVLPVIFGCAWYTVSKKNVPLTVWLLSVLAWSALIVSLSRSLVMGVGVGLISSVALLFLFRHDIGYVWSTGAREHTPFVGVARVLAMVIGSLLLAAGLFYAPPRPSGSLTSLVVSRTNLAGDAAVSRWTLLPALVQGIRRHPLLGSGFGATITYRSRDPRVVAATGGSYTTYAFEWGWLDHWFKFGLLGIPLMLWVVARLLIRSWRSSQPFWIRATLTTSLLALAMTHLFTPYLNHPLGIVWLVSVEAWLSMEFV